MKEAQNKSLALHGQTQEVNYINSTKFQHLLQTVPMAMRNHPNWVLWKLIQKEGKSKADKVPFSASSLLACNPSDPDSWAAFDQAYQCLITGNGNFNGIGYCMNGDFVCVDLDGALDENGEAKPWAVEVLEGLPDTFIEVSQSGRGLHCFLTGVLPEQRNKLKTPEGNQVEIYSQKRFIAMTGIRYKEAPLRVADGQDYLNALYIKYPGQPKPLANESGLPYISHNDLWEIMFNAKNGDAIQRLFNGNTSAYGGDDSSADMALMNHLAFYTGKSPSQMEKMFSECALGKRDKWIKRADYRRRTIEVALNSITDVYQHSLKQSLSNSFDGDLLLESQRIWPKPKPFPSALPPVEAFDPFLLPEGVRSFVEDVANRMQCPVDFPAVAIMVAMGSIIGRQLGIRPKAQDDWLVVPNLWGVAIGRPSVMKSPSLKEPLRLLEVLEEREREVYEAKQKEYEAQALINEALEKHQKEKIRDGIKKQDGKAVLAARQLVDHRHTDCVEPTRKRYLVHDTTTEKLIEILCENPNGVLLYRDELTGFIRTLEKQGREADRAFYLESWNGDSRVVQDRISRGTIEVPAACVSLLGTIQPGPLKALFRNAFGYSEGQGNDGFFQRIQLAVWPDNRSRWQNVDRHPNQTAKDHALQKFEFLASLNPVELGAHVESGSLPYLRFSSEAQAAFNQWRETWEVQLMSDDYSPALEAHFAKYRSLIPSLALICHVANGDSGPVTEKALLQALGWGDYLASHAKRIYGAGFGPDYETAKLLLKRIKEGKLTNPFTQRDVYRAGWSGLTNKKQVQETIEVLEDLGYLRGEHQETGGRPTEFYWIHPEFLGVA